MDNWKILKTDMRNIVFFSILFLFFFVFYFQVHPLVPFNTDDWGLMNVSRGFYPQWGIWNPIKVLPECLYAGCSLFASYFVILFTKDYLTSLILTHSVMVAGAITIYSYFLYKLLYQKFKLDQLTNYFLVVIFLIFHFWVLKTSGNNNDYLLFARDVTCYYHYVIPNLLCSSVVMCLMSSSNQIEKNYTKLALWVFIFYLVIFSNLFCSIIVLSYLGASLLMDFCRQYGLSFSLNQIIQFLRKRYEIIVFFFWIISLIYEANGARAGNLAGYGSEAFGIADNFLAVISIKWKLSFFLAFIFIFGFVGYMKMANKEEFRHSIILLVAFIVTFAFVFLLSARASYSMKTAYIKLPMVMFSFSFYLLLSSILALAFVIKKYEKLIIFLPVIALLLFCQVRSEQNVVKDVARSSGFDVKSCIEFDRRMIDKVRKAAMEGTDTVYLAVPDYGGKNWPLIKEEGHVIGEVLYKHGQLIQPVKTFFVLE